MISSPLLVGTQPIWIDKIEMADLFRTSRQMAYNNAISLTFEQVLLPRRRRNWHECGRWIAEIELLDKNSLTSR